MAKYSGDLQEGGLAKEATRGTFVPSQYGIKWEEFSVVDKAIIAQDESRSGILEDARNSHVVGTFAEGDIGGPVRDLIIGLPILSMFGTVADALVQTGVYDHTFDMQAGNQKQSLSLSKKNSNAGGSQDHALCMVSKLELTVEEKGIAMFNASVRALARASQTIGTFTVTIAAPGVFTLTGHKLQTGDAITLSTTGALPTGLTAATVYYVVKVDADTFNLATTLANALAATKITTSGSQSGVHTATLSTRYIAYTSENVFRQQDCTFKLAGSQSGLGAASAINVRSAKLSLDGGVEDDRTIGAVAPVDIVNTTLKSELEVELVVTDETYPVALLAGTAYAARLDFNNTTVTIGASSNPRLYFDCYRVILQDVPVKFQKGKLTLVTLKFKILYSEADAKSVRAILRNTVAAY